MSDTWTVAAVQTDVRLGDRAANLEMIRTKLAAAADRGARLVVFPECALTGYGVADRRHALALAEELPGPATETVAADCRRLGVFAVFGLLERAGDRVYNSCAIVGPAGFVAGYRKLHLPCVGADRFTDPGDRPFAVHDLGGLRVGVHICFDGSFPEAPRVLTLLGADLLLLPTNWAEKAMTMATLVPRVRAFENHVYYMAVNRVGEEAGYRYIGRSSVSGFGGEYLAFADHDREETLFAEIDPAAARRKKVVHCAGEYEIDRVNWRRPDVYGHLVEGPAFGGHRRA
jgi:predicted amidohydrolase